VCLKKLIITCNIGSSSFSYNDLNTRNNGQWTSHTFQFNISTAGNYNISFVYTNTATVSSVFDACFSNISITKYNGIQESDGTNLSLFSPNLSIIRNPYLYGNIFSIGSHAIQGALSLSSAYGFNIPINNSFGSTSGSNNTNCIAIGPNLSATSCNYSIGIKQFLLVILFQELKQMIFL